jgi:hypothetical protein
MTARRTVRFPMLVVMAESMAWFPAAAVMAERTTRFPGAVVMATAVEAAAWS